jgi:hypothetical protein
MCKGGSLRMVGPGESAWQERELLRCKNFPNGSEETEARPRIHYFPALPSPVTTLVEEQ